LKIEHPGKYVLEAVLRNDYKKDITAVVSSVGMNSFHMDYVYAERESSQKLAPGKSDTFTYALTPSLGENPQVVVSAVLFSDGTSRGNPEEIQFILDKRLGTKIQLDRMNPYLAQLSKTKESQIRSKLRRLKGICESLQINSNDGSWVSPGLEHGLMMGRDLVLNYLSKLEASSTSQRISTFYQNGALQTASRGGISDFSAYLAKVQYDFKNLAGRL
jgi:hypothetical protein